MLENLKIIDLTHTLSPQTPSWDGSCGFEHETSIDYEDFSTEAKFRVQTIKMHAGIGTHMDAPSHCFKNAKNIADLALETLITSCIVIDVSSKSHERYLATPEDIKTFEKTHRQIPKGAFVIFYTGWDKHWSTPEQYRNNHIFPSVSKEAAQLLLERDVAGLGIDTLSPDRPDSGFPVHQEILGAGKYIVENIANASKLPPIGSYSFALPIKVAGGTEAPIRLIALEVNHV